MEVYLISCILSYISYTYSHVLNTKLSQFVLILYYYLAEWKSLQSVTFIMEGLASLPREQSIELERSAMINSPNHLPNAQLSSDASVCKLLFHRSISF